MDMSAALLYLTLAIFKEAEGESHAGKVWVGDTVINRVKSSAYPDSVCEVVLQQKQFTWANPIRERNLFGMISYQQQTLNHKRMTPRRWEAYRQSEKIAKKMLQPGYRPSHYFLYFHSGVKLPKQAEGKKLRVIGNHFYY